MRDEGFAVRLVADEISREKEESEKQNFQVQKDEGAEESNTYYLQSILSESEWRRLQLGLSREDYELKMVDGVDGHVFEEWCAQLLRVNCFSDVTVTKGSGDQGVDILAEKGGVKYAVQCKCYSRDLGNKPVQEVNAGKTFYGCHVGVVMTNAHFTSGAKELAKATGVLLWDRDAIKAMMKSKS